MDHVFNWIEIPVSDMNRAIKFYSDIFGYDEMSTMNMGGAEMAFFPMKTQEGVGGALVYGEGYKPTKEGVQVYFACGENLQVPLDKVKAAGGVVIIPKTLIREDIGYFAKIMDSEGNIVNLHSTK